MRAGFVAVLFGIMPLAGGCFLGEDAPGRPEHTEGAIEAAAQGAVDHDGLTLNVRNDVLGILPTGAPSSKLLVPLQGGPTATTVVSNLVTFGADGDPLLAGDFVADSVHVLRNGLLMQTTVLVGFLACNSGLNPADTGASVWLPDATCGDFDRTVFRITDPALADAEPLEFPVASTAIVQSVVRPVEVLAWFPNDGEPAFHTWCIQEQPQFDKPCPPDSVVLCHDGLDREQSRCAQGTWVSGFDQLFARRYVGENDAGDALMANGDIIRISGDALWEVDHLDIDGTDLTFNGVDGPFVTGSEGGGTSGQQFTLDTRDGDWTSAWTLEWAVGDELFFGTPVDGHPEAVSEPSLVRVNGDDSFTTVPIRSVRTADGQTISFGYGNANFTDIDVAHAFLNMQRPYPLFSDRGTSTWFVARNLCGESGKIYAGPSTLTIDVCAMHPDGTITWVAGPLPFTDVADGIAAGEDPTAYGLTADWIVARVGASLLQAIRMNGDEKVTLFDGSASGAIIERADVGGGRVAWVARDADGSLKGAIQNLDDGTRLEFNPDAELEQVLTTSSQ
ncbi:MAG: hypothetical protein D6761_13870 [Candidatus Dadabacteria bacterium]|nr:MAG: hypothetical protein D6761_13870 [Candidatus Dadabacteria bacterium]